MSDAAPTRWAPAVPRRGARRVRGSLLLVALVALLVLPTAPASADSPRPDGEGAWFGPVLDVRRDSLPGYADRLGASPSLVSVEVAYPLDGPATELVRTVAEQAAASGTVVVLDVSPTQTLVTLSPADADQLARVLRVLERDRGTRFLVRFAPEMNGSWVPWGQQPRDYVAAFRMVAAALHANSDAGTVWAPAYGAGYPFDRSRAALDEVLVRDRSALDTSGDGRVDAADDPYGPYYPGDPAVDWVGLSMVGLSQSSAEQRNAVQPRTELAQRLAERWGYGDDRRRRSFVARFATSERPLLVETAAPYNPAVGGASERAVKRAWWGQLLAAMDRDERIGGATWLEARRPEPELRDTVLDWRATARTGLADTLRRDLALADRPRLAPVYEAHDRDSDLVTPQPEGPAPGDDPTLDDRAASPAWWWLGAGALLVLAVLAGLLRPRWLDVDTAERDPRADVARGSVLLGSVAALVVTLGLDVGSMPAWLVVGGVSTLLAVSGWSHLLAEHRRADVGGAAAAVLGHLRRAVVLYVAAVVLTLLHLLLDAAPGVASPFGSYSRAGQLLALPPASGVATDLLALRITPGPVVLLGLFACLAVLASVVGPVCRRGRWWAALAASWVGFVVGAATGWHLPAVGWEAGWPLLVWQVPFVHAMVVAHVLLTDPERGRRVALTVLGLVGLGVAGWGALVLPGLAPSTQPTLVVALLSATTVVAVTVLGWGPVRKLLGWTSVAGRRPLAVSALLLLAVLGASLV